MARWLGRSEPAGAMAGVPGGPAETPAQQEFQRLGPWLSRFVIDGVPLGGTFDYSTDPRPLVLERRLGSLAGKRILELGALEGGHTLTLAARGATVLAVEGRPANYERCRFIQRHFGLARVEFVLGDLRSVDFATLGRFDAVLNSGVLYHLDAPWDLLARLARVAPAMLIWTHCAAAAETAIGVGGETFEGSWYPEPVEHSLSGTQARSFWPTRATLTRMLEVTGWPAVTWLEFDPAGLRGPAATLWVERG